MFVLRPTGYDLGYQDIITTKMENVRHGDERTGDGSVALAGSNCSWSITSPDWEQALASHRIQLNLL